MFQNDYGDVIEKWKVDLILARAKRLGFRRHDLEDAQQQIVPVVLRFAFEPERSNGASEATALVALIDHQLIMMRRARDRYARRVSPLEESSRGEELALTVPGDGACIAKSVDVRDAVTDLPPLTQQVCSALGEGRTVNETAHHLGVGWHTVKRHVSGIRGYFEHLGLDDWMVA